MGCSSLKWLFLLAVALFGNMASLQAQTLGEFLNQKKKQKQYLLQQIAALQVYIGYAKKGYDIVGSGLETVRDFKNGEFSLHQNFISSLKKVSPAVRGNAKIMEIIELQVSIRSAFNGVRSGDFLSAATLSYIAKVRENVLTECDNDLEELLLVITSGKLEMGDDERLERLDQIYLSMRNKSEFVQDFTGQLNLLIRQKKNEQYFIDQLRRSYENN